MKKCKDCKSYDAGFWDYKTFPDHGTCNRQTENFADSDNSMSSYDTISMERGRGVIVVGKDFGCVKFEQK